MDDLEKRVLRKNRAELAKVISADDIADELRKRHVLSEEASQVIVDEKSSDRRVWRLIERLSYSSASNVFQSLCDVLSYGEYEVLAKKLQIDLQAEKGDLYIDDDIKEDVSALIHRKFGTSKRLTAQDKKNIEDVVAIKLQVSRESWQDEIDSTRKEIKHITEKHDYYESNVHELDDILQNFMKSYRNQLVTYAHDIKTPKETLKNSDADFDFMAQLTTKLKYLINCSKRIIQDRDLLWNERDKCLEELGLSKRGETISSLVRDKVGGLNETIDKLECKIDDKEGQLKHQVRRMDSLETMVEQRDKRIELLEDKVNKLSEIQAEQLVTIQHFEKEKADLIETNAVLKEMRPGSPMLRPRTASRSDKTPDSPVLGARAGSPDLRLHIPGSPVLRAKNASSPNLRRKTPDSPELRPKTPSSPNLRKKSPGSPSFRPKHLNLESPRTSSPKLYKET